MCCRIYLGGWADVLLDMDSIFYVATTGTRPCGSSGRAVLLFGLRSRLNRKLPLISRRP
jgi:hypothetical protein